MLFDWHIEPLPLRYVSYLYSPIYVTRHFPEAVLCLHQLEQVRKQKAITPKVVEGRNHEPSDANTDGQ